MNFINEMYESRFKEVFEHILIAISWPAAPVTFTFPF